MLCKFSVFMESKYDYYHNHTITIWPLLFIFNFTANSIVYNAMNKHQENKTLIIKVNKNVKLIAVIPIIETKP